MMKIQVHRRCIQGGIHHAEWTRDCGVCRTPWPCDYALSHPEENKPLDYCYCGSSWPCRVITQENIEDRRERATGNRKPHFPVTDSFGMPTCISCNEMWPCDWNKKRLETPKPQLQVAIFEEISSGLSHSVRADNLDSLILQRCNKGCPEGYHWLVETKGAGGMRRKFEARLVSVS